MQTLENNLKIFENKEFGSIRTLLINDEVWFVGKDVATILGYKDTSDALKRHVDEEDKLTRCFTDTGQKRKMIIINESGLYSLVLSSKLPQAKAFKRWITSEVLPSLRKNGFYGQVPTMDNLLSNPRYFAKVLENLADEQEKNKVLQLENKELTNENNELKEDKIILTNKNEELTLNNKVLSEEILTWDNRAVLNSVIRTLATKLRKPFQFMWGIFYKELLYKHGINLKNRGKSPFIQHIREDEYGKVLSTLVAICEDNDLNFAEIVNKEFNVNQN